MSEEANSSDEEIRQDNSENPNNGQSANNEDGTIKKEDYINLQSDYTKKSQALKELTVERARENPKSILDIKDLKLQNKVVNEIYGLNSISEVKFIYGDEFYKSENESEINDVEKLKREVAILKNNSEASKLESAIRDLKNTNKDIFASTENAEEKLREALQLLSPTINSEERVRLASKLVFGNIVNPTSAGFQALQTASVSGGNGASEQTNKTKINTKESELRSFLGLK